MGLRREDLLAIHLAHVDLFCDEQSLEQHRGGVGEWQYGWGFDPSLEFFVQTLDRIGSTEASML